METLGPAVPTDDHRWCGACPKTIMIIDEHAFPSVFAQLKPTFFMYSPRSSLVYPSTRNNFSDFLGTNTIFNHFFLFETVQSDDCVPKAVHINNMPRRKSWYCMHMDIVNLQRAAGGLRFVEQLSLRRVAAPLSNHKSRRHTNRKIVSLYCVHQIAQKTVLKQQTALL